MLLLRIVIFVAAAAFAYLIFWAMGADDRGLEVVVPELLGQPWGAVTLADLYLGFFLGAVVIVLFERRLWVGLAWALPIFVLGNVWTALWFVVRLPAIRDRFNAATPSSE